MSLGQIVGGIAGGVIGFFMGGPMGAVYGAGMGYALGGMIDPNTPDMPTPGAPDVKGQVMTSAVGDPVPEILGTAKITGHLLAYGKERVVELTETQEGGGKGGGGGATTQVVGHEYYMTWVLGICKGPVDTLYTVFKGEDVVWEGELKLADAVNGEETITLEGMGVCTFYFGTSDQVANIIIDEIIPDSNYNTPYRNFCWALLDDNMIGNYERTPTLSFVVTKIPEYSFSDSPIIQKYDCNPAHALWYILHDLSGLPESWLNDSAFAALARTLVTEYRGISILFVTQQTALNYITTVNSHIDNILLYGVDGKFSPKLIRNDYNVSTVPSIDEPVLLDDPTFTRKSWNDTVNELKVQYTELINVEREKVLYGMLWGTGTNGTHGLLAIGDNSGYKTALTRSIFTEKLITMAAQAHFLAITEDGHMYGCGYDSWWSWGELNDPGYSLTLVDSVKDLLWESVSCGRVLSMAIDVTGSLWGTGINSHGILGIGSTAQVSEWTLVDSGSWRQIDTNYLISLGIKNGGTLWGCGRKSLMGVASTTGSSYTFMQLGIHASNPSELGTGWTDITSSMNGTIGINGSTIWVTGYDAWGNIGLGEGDFPGTNYYNWNALLGMWTSVYAQNDAYGFFALDSGGSLYYTGKNEMGQGGFGHLNVINGLTLVPGLPAIQDVAVSVYCCAVLDVDGHIWSTGANTYISSSAGALGQGDLVNRTSFEQISDDVYLTICSQNRGFFATKM